MSDNKIYDTAIIGGGLAGLTLSISLTKQGYSVILFEKETYPFHKVCGEYISLESWHYLETEIGVPLTEMHLPIIKKLWITSPNGNSLYNDLDLGGFGISRYTLDNTLKNIAQNMGVTILQNCKAEDVQFAENVFTIKTTQGIYQSNVCCGSWGKRSNFDVKWKRPFTSKTNDRLNNFVGIKYHVKLDFPYDMIALHNFKNGYCGISKIEDDKYCVCYLTKASNIKNAGSIEKAEEQILSENPHLKNLFGSMQKLYNAPVSISQISFSKKNAAENNVLMLGDAAGMITPLCGNGMSMAMHSAKIASTNITAFLQNNITRQQLEYNYTKNWESNFSRRIKIGKFVQYLFGRKTTTNIFVSIMKKSKILTKKIISLTHGDSF
jgi:flavin-dependent dehydrogenase